MTEYTPDEEHMKVAWIEYDDAATDINEAEAEFDRFLARVKRDAAREALAALAAAEHRATRAEAQSAIRGRAVTIYRERAQQAEARIKAVRALHTGTRWPGVTDKPICDECDMTCPCPTIRALDGDA